MISVIAVSSATICCIQAVENDLVFFTQVSYPPVQQRLPGNTSLTLLNSHIPVSVPSTQSELPYLSTQADFASPASLSHSQLPQIPVSHQPPAPTHAWAQHTAAPPNVVPRPPRPRPSSAGTRRGSGDRVGVAANSPTSSPLPPRRGKYQCWWGIVIPPNDIIIRLCLVTDIVCEMFF